MQGISGGFRLGYIYYIYNLYIYIYIHMGYIIIWLGQELLYHRTCKRDFLCSWPSLNSYLK